jgi:hypothetical protein
MSNERSHRTAVAIFAIGLAVVIIAASVATFHGIETKVADNGLPPGTVGLAQPHAPLDSSPGTAIHY